MFLFTIFLLLPFTTPILVPLVIRNQCPDTIWPAISTQAGKGPSIGGFQLSAGSTQNLSVDTSWNGRVWGRTNCTFDSRGRGTCGTGDCGGNLNCVSSVSVYFFLSYRGLTRDERWMLTLENYRAPVQHSPSSISQLSRIRVSTISH